MIGVPLTSKTSVAGGLDALLSVAQMPPGCPVASVAWTTRGTPPSWRAHDLGRVIERYTRPEMGVVWSEQRKLDTWLEVELAWWRRWPSRAPCPPGTPTRSASRASFTVEAVKEREKVTDHDVAAFVDVVADSVGRPGAGCTTA